MKREELVKLKRILNKELERRARSNLLLQEDLVREYLELNGISAERLQIEDMWPILKEILNNFEITDTNGILVYINSYMVESRICYEETDYYTKAVSFDDNDAQWQTFKSIETEKYYKGFIDDYIREEFKEAKRYGGYPSMSGMSLSEFCHKRHNCCLVSELMQKYTILNPYNSSKNQNGFEEVRKDFFETAITKGQPSAKKLVLSKYPMMR